MTLRFCVFLTLCFVVVVECKPRVTYKKTVTITDDDVKRYPECASWSERKCKKWILSFRRCPSPPQIPHAYVDSKFYQSNSSLKLYFKCARGYEMKGDNRVYCFKVTISHYVWSMPAFTCHPTSCPEPHNPENGLVVGDSYEIGKKISFECKTGYSLYSADGNTKLDVSPQQICHVMSGKWVGTKPICIKDGSNETEGELKSRKMEKSKKEKDDGGECPLPPDVEHGYIDEELWKEGLPRGTVVTFKCATGFEIKGNGSVVCLKVDGGKSDWSTPNFTCEQSYCKHPSDPVGGRVIGSDFGLGKSITFECFEPLLMYSADDKDQLQESPRLTCSENATWVGEKPLCHVSMCPDITPIPNGFIESISRLPGGKAIFKCNSGFMRIGNHERICSSTGDWTGKTPRCTNARSLEEFYDEDQDDSASADHQENKVDQSSPSFSDYMLKAWNEIRDMLSFEWVKKLNEQLDYTVFGVNQTSNSI